MQHFARGMVSFLGDINGMDARAYDSVKDEEAEKRKVSGGLCRFRVYVSVR